MPRPCHSGFGDDSGSLVEELAVPEMLGWAKLHELLDLPGRSSKYTKRNSFVEKESCQSRANNRNIRGKTPLEFKNRSLKAFL